MQFGSQPVQQEPPAQQEPGGEAQPPGQQEGLQPVQKPAELRLLLRGGGGIGDKLDPRPGEPGGDHRGGWAAHTHLAVALLHQQRPKAAAHQHQGEQHCPKELPGDLAALLTNLNEGDILFVDEIHRLNRSVEEILYPAMEDYAIDIIIGKGPSANSIRLDLPKFTLIGATTRAGQLSAPLRDRFGVTLRLELYTPEELALIVTRSAGILGVPIQPEGAMEIARRSRGTPRIANRMLRRVRDFAQVKGDGTITRSMADHALQALEIDYLGLDPVDRRMLRAIIENYGGGPVGLDTLAATIGEESVTLEDVYEPYLMQLGFLTRTPRGRCVTRKAYEHLHMDFVGQEQLEI